MNVAAFLKEKGNGPFKSIYRLTLIQRASFDHKESIVELLFPANIKQVRGNTKDIRVCCLLDN